MSDTTNGATTTEERRKYLRVTMPDGSKWDVPAFLIAENKAIYYASKESDPEENSKVYVAEKKAMLEGDDYEIEDWAGNNMDWSDIEKYAKRGRFRVGVSSSSRAGGVRSRQLGFSR